MSGTKTKSKKNEPGRPQRRTSPPLDDRNPVSRGRSNSFRDIMLGAALLLLAALIAHFPALQSQALSLDDDAFLVDNPLVRSPGPASVTRFFSEVLAPSTVKGYYIPLTMTSLMIDYALGGRPDDLTQFHITSLILHIAVVWLIAACFRLLFNHPLPALLAGLIAAVHPLTVEPIVWIAERKTMLAGFWSMLSLFCYLRSVKTTRRRFLIASLLAYLGALLSKPTSVPLPFILLILDMIPLRRLNRKAITEKLPFFALMLASAVITLISHGNTASVESSGSRTVLLLFYNLSFYVAKLLLPVDLSSCYPPPLPFTIANPSLWGSIAIVIGISAAAAILLRRFPALSAGWLIYGAALIPTAGLVSYSWVVTSDKYIYPLPLFGLLMIPVALIHRLVTDARFRVPVRHAILAGALIVIGACMIQTRNVAANWRTTETLYNHMIASSPDVALLHNNLGLELARQNRHAEAVDRYRRALELKPDASGTMNNYGLSLMALGRNDDALEQFRAGARLDPTYWLAHNNIAYLLTMKGNLDEAEAAAAKALELNPHAGGAYINMGRIKAYRNQTDEAIRCFSKAVELNPTLHTAWSNLGAMHVQAGQVAEAEKCYKRALAIKPDFVEGLSNYGRLKNQLGAFPEAETLFRKALGLNPNFAPAAAGLGRALLGQNRSGEAERALLHAKKLAPADPEIQRMLDELPRQNP